MARYIELDALVAEIERRRDAALTRQQNLEAIGQETVLNKMVANELNLIISLINTFEVKEVDLENELNDFIEQQKAWIKDDRVVEYNNGDSFNHIYDLEEIAKHFFELGLKAQIMTSKLQQRISVLKMGFWTGLQTFEETEMTLSDAYNQGVDDILEELGLKAQKGE